MKRKAKTTPRKAPRPMMITLGSGFRWAENVSIRADDSAKRCLKEHEKDALLRHKDMLLDEMQHRLANSLQIIASIILMKANAVQSEETRGHLKDAHGRIVAVAAVQRHLRAAAPLEPIDVGPYLARLCDALSHALISDTGITLTARGNGGTATRRDAESLGLIVTELVINSIKHAFVKMTASGTITVAYDASPTGWTLSVSDNGAGVETRCIPHPGAGLGTGIVKALAGQLDARLEMVSGPSGTSVLLTHGALAMVGAKAA